MKFYSGFSLKNESYLFDAFIKDTEFTVCGFSYGAIKAFEYVKKELACGHRIDTLQLFSPAFFQSKTKEFKRLQLMAYRRNEEVYLRQFINACFAPHALKIVESSVTILDELDELLYFQWVFDELHEIVEQGVKIEVYLGSEDRIIDAENAKHFFLQVATVTYIKNANHFLQIN
ncbi:MAG: pimelyl-ACP methyl ester esterase BioV [Campylobacterales bacterium]|nr:pimelyl-ACP methyl ester esterase BioV [Campylobacterales bacterium]